MAKAVFATYFVTLLNLVEHSCSVGMLGTVRVSGAECGLIRDMRYMPDDGHLAAHKFLLLGCVSIIFLLSPWNV